MIHGENVILCLTKAQSGNTGLSDLFAVGGAKSCDIDMDQDFISVCSPVSGRWRNYLPRTIGYTAEISGLVCTMAEPKAWINEMITSSTPLTMRFFDMDAGIYKVGQVYISSLKSSAQVGSITTYSISLQGTGALADAGDADYPWFWRDTLFLNKPMDAVVDGQLNIDGGVVDNEWAKNNTTPTA